MISENFIYLGAALNLIGSSTYVLHTLQGKTKPNRVTWFLWALAPLIAFAAQLDEGVGKQAILTFVVGFGPLLVFAASFINRKSIWKLTRFDFACGALSVLGLILWLVTDEGNLAIALSIAADGLAALPTVVKSFKEPETESYTVFLLGAVNAALTLLTIKVWAFAEYGFALYILIICLLLFTLIKFEVGKKLLART